MKSAVLLYERKIAKAMIIGPVLTDKKVEVKTKTATDTSETQETKLEQKPESPFSSNKLHPEQSARCSCVKTEKKCQSGSSSKFPKKTSS